MVTKRGRKENIIKNLHAKKKKNKGKENNVVLLTVCKQNKYFQEYTARSPKEKKKKKVSRELYGGNH